MLFALLTYGLLASGNRSADAATARIPILFNDRNVAPGADVVKSGRVLAALFAHDRLYLPLRAMLEAMGAHVSVSSGGKTVVASKDGASVSVTVGKNEVIVNGESRPLDVPPMLYRGTILVPVRVLSEALGAYVLWLPERRVVVMRYNPPAPPPAAAPTAEPTVAPPPAPAAPVPTALPTAAPASHTYQGFVEGAFSIPKNYNEFADGQHCPESYLLSAGYAFKQLPLAVKVDFREDSYLTTDYLVDRFSNHYTRFATIDGGVALTPEFLARQHSLDARLEFKIAAPRIYVGVGYLSAGNNYGYPQLSGVGFGLEKLPDLRGGLNFFTSAFYYPDASGTYTVADPASPNAGAAYRQQYRFLKYDVGLQLGLKRFPFYVYGGFSGDRYFVKANAPLAQTHDGPYAGLGVKI